MNGIAKALWILVAAVVLVTRGAAAEKLTEAQKEQVGRMIARFRAADTNHNGTLSLDEYRIAYDKRIEEAKAELGDKWNPALAAKLPPADDVFKSADTDANGALTGEEMRQASRKLWKAMDDLKKRLGAARGRGQGRNE